MEKSFIVLLAVEAFLGDNTVWAIPKTANEYFNSTEAYFGVTL